MRRLSKFSNLLIESPRASTLALALGLSFSAASPAWALPTDVRPIWSHPAQICDSPNNSFLMELSRTTGTEEAEYRAKIFDPKLAVQMRRQYEDGVRDYEMRDRQHLTTLEDKRAHSSWMSDFAHNVVNEVKNYHVQANVKKVRTAVEKDPTVQVVKGPVVIVAGVYAIGTGQPINIHLSDKTQFTTRTDVRSHKGQFQLSSPLLNSSFEMATRAPSDRDPYAPLPDDPTQRDERYKVSVSRGLPFLDMSSGVSYGTTTSTVSASVTKQLMDNLSCVLDTSRTTKPSVNNASSGQETVRLIYGMSF